MIMELAPLYPFSPGFLEFPVVNQNGFFLLDDFFFQPGGPKFIVYSPQAISIRVAGISFGGTIAGWTNCSLSTTVCSWVSRQHEGMLMTGILCFAWSQVNFHPTVERSHSS